MPLEQYLKDNYIDLKAIERIRKRVFIVGRFNMQKAGGEDTEVHLFTNRSDLTDTYKQNFTAYWTLNYDNFVKALKPAIAEKSEHTGRFVSIEQVIPQEVADADPGTYVMDTYNYFFQRAVLTCNQKAFEREKPRLPKMLEADERDRGKTILMQIRKNLRTFCEFQPHTYKLVNMMVLLLSQCAGDNNMPYFAAGAALPGNFAERLIDFLYAEDTRQEFSLEGIDFNRDPWKKLTKDAAGRQMFAKVVSALRDALVSDNVSNYNAERFGAKTLSQMAKGVVEGEYKGLTEHFRRSRDAFNGLRQILRSKVLLSMVLEWLLSAYYDRVASDIPNTALYEERRDRAVEEAILQGTHGLAAPVKRPSKKARKNFAKTLTANFATMMTAVLTPEDQMQAQLDKLPQEMHELVASMRSDPSLRQTLSVISGFTTNKHDDAQFKAFNEAMRIIMLDVMCPVLYRSPIVSRRELKKYFREECMTAYLTAIFLSEKNEEMVRRIAEDHLEFFESKIDDVTKEIHDTGEIQKRLLKDFVQVLASPEVEKRLSEGIRVLQEVHKMMYETEGTRVAGAGSVSAIRPLEELIGREDVDLQKKSPASVQVVERAVERVASDAVTRRIDRIAARAQQSTFAAAAGGASASAGGPPTGDGAAGTALQPVDGAVALAEEEEDDTAAGADPMQEIGGGPQPTRLENKIDRILSQVLPEDGPVPTSADGNPLTDDDRKAIADQVKQEVMKEEPFVGSLIQDLGAFDRTLHLIYSRYSDPNHVEKVTFRNRVERMTLINMMLLFDDNRVIGKDQSYLYRMLIDLVLHADPETGDPESFLDERSLTLYFDNEKLRDGGITELRQMLGVQARKSLMNIVNFVSELRGMKYLMDLLRTDTESEVIVVNASAREFVQFLRNDNLENATRGRLRGCKLTKTNEAAETVILPGIAYLTDAAFSDGTKEEFVAEMASSNFQMSDQRNFFLLPPMVMSLDKQNSLAWRRQGVELAQTAHEAPAPFIILGPSPYLNDVNDGFPTSLPAGYMFSAHFLGRQQQGITIPNERTPSQGRFRVVSVEGKHMADVLEFAVWGEGPEDYRFSVDFYLYLLLVLWTAAPRSALPPDPQKFFSDFYLAFDGMPAPDYTKAARLIDRAVVGGNASRFALMQQVSATSDLNSVAIAVNKTANLAQEGVERWLTRDVEWFNVAKRKVLG